MEQCYDFLSGISHQSLQMAVNGLWAGLVLTGLAFWALRYARATNAATRYLIWWSLLTVVIALPLFMGSAVGDSSPQRAGRSWHSTSDLSLAATDYEKKLSRPTPVVERTQPKTAESRIRRSERPVLITPESNPESGSAVSLIAGVSPVLLFGIWTIAVALLGWRLLLSLRKMRGIKRRSYPLDLSHLSHLDRALQRAAARRPVRVCLSSEVEYPMAAGLGKPTILIPAELIGQMSDGELEAIVLHELAHILRWDDWTKLGQKIVEAVLCFHPAVHWIGRQLDLERELACDDQVVVQTGKPGDYARCLTRLVQLTTGSATSLVPGALTSRKQIVKRFERLLLKRKESGFRFSAKRFAGALVPIALVVIAAAQYAPVVALPIDYLSYGELSQQLRNIYAEPEPISGGPAVVVPSANDDLGKFLEVQGVSPADLAQYAPVALLPQVVPGPSPRKRYDDGTFKNEYEASRYEDYERELGWIALNDAVPEPPHVPAVPAAPPVPSVPHVLSVPSPPSAPAAPSPPIGWVVGSDAFMFDDGRHDGTIISRDGDRQVTVTWSDGGDRLSVSVEGEIEFTDDDRGIKSLSPGGFLEIEEERGRHHRLLEVESDRDGELEYGYYERGRAREFDDEAREWMGDVLREAIRKTGLGAEARAARILKKHGADGILGEVEEIESDYVKRIYLDELLAYDGLEKSDHPKIVRVVSREIDSDYEKAEMLVNLADRARYDADLLVLLVDAAETIDSDYEVRRVLSKLVLDREVSEEVAETVLRIASRMDSDYERAELLIDMSRNIDADDNLRRAYLMAAGDIDSDYEIRRVLTAGYLDRDLDSRSIEYIMDVARDIDSDYEKAELLIDLSKLCRDNEDLQRMLLRATSSLDSDYEMRRVLSSLRLDCQKTPNLTGDVFEITMDLDSDYERAEVLLELADCVGTDRSLARKFMEAASHIDSDYETKRVMRKLIAGADLNDDLVSDILRIVDDLDSDYEKTEVLTALVDYCRDNERLEDEFIDVIESMDSDFEIDKMYSLLHRRGRGDR